ncbi:MAG: aminodeoxychorismate synthase component I [Actinomycetota bacterium]|nr:aminodeoxychorismate synthase component I [Actinomycetota bacterium]
MVGLHDVLTASTLDEVVPTLMAVEAATASGSWAAGFIAYDASPGLDPRLVVPGVARPERAPGGRSRHAPSRSAQPVDRSADVPLVWFALFDRCEPIAAVSDHDEAHQPLQWELATTSRQYRDRVETIQRAIADGLTYQCNLTERLRAPFDGDAAALYRSMVLAQRGRYGALVDTGAVVVASASPELFFEWRGNVVTTRPMKGTAERGRSAAEDAAAADALVRSAKDRAENIMIVDLLRNDLGRISSWGSVEVPALCSLERLQTVWQLTSTVTGTLRPGTGLVDVLRALFPCGSVTGAPKHRTMALIAGLEHDRRGVYCGAIGMVAPPGGPGDLRARFSVAIRTAVVDRMGGRAEFGSGGGITWSSSPDAEWAELWAKTRVLGGWTGAFHLFETMAWTPSAGRVGGHDAASAAACAAGRADRAAPDGTGSDGAPLTGCLAWLRNGPAHLARLETSAAYFGFAFDRQRVLHALRLALGTTVPPRRVRLALARDGTPSVTLAPMPAAGGEPVRLAIDREPFDTSGPWPFHKTSRRHPYEHRARQHPDVDDVVLVNDLGDVTETTIANLAVRIGGRWWTPPVASGCLPGIGRAQALAAGGLHERALTVADVRGAEGLATVSSLRGWRCAQLDDTPTTSTLPEPDDPAVPPPR